MRPSSSLSQIETEISDIFSSNRIMRGTAEALRAALLEKIVKEVNSKTPAGKRRYSVWLAGYVSGFIAAKDRALMQNEVEFCYRDSAGTLFSIHRESVHRKTEEFYQAGKGILLSDMESAFVWKGSDKPFTAWGTTASKRPNQA